MGFKAEKVKVDLSGLLIPDQFALKKELLKFKPSFITEKLLIVTFNQKVEDLLFEYGLHNYEEYK